MTAPVKPFHIVLRAPEIPQNTGTIASAQGRLSISSTH